MGKNTELNEKSIGSNVVLSPHTCGHIGAGEEACLFSIVPVQVKTPKGDTVLQTHAFLDHGSSSTFCTENLMRRLNVTGQKASILLRTMNQEKPVTSHHISGLEISSLDKNDFIQLSNVFTHKTMPVSKLNIPKIDGGIDLLIGTNASKVLEPWEVVNSQGNGPHAVRTLLGWVIYGPLRGDNDVRWPDGDVQQDFVEYRMKVHLFGAVTSPSCANFALMTAEDNKAHFPAEVTDTVKNNFYVHDCLKSMSTEQDAVLMVKDLTALCQKGGFVLSKWISNSHKVLASIPQENRTKETKELDLDRDNLPIERAQDCTGALKQMCSCSELLHSHEHTPDAASCPWLALYTTL
ncbi:hypothetical protein PO909_002442 [Leuciscus waleckii]